MHGWFAGGGRGGGAEKWKQRRHMWPVPANSTTVAAVAANNSSSSSPDFFLKDGRKIHVGDSALFKPPKDSPPFIGIIRKLTGVEESLSLGVNWLYRHSDVKLGKGVLLDAAPNEVFYSFHKDEIPAASLLHPCKVAFLHKGVELPSGISSFVCRRVYDIENKCLWWLTDKDYINERQEEVDKLLDKTQLEMHGVVQSGGRSPKPLNGPTPTTQLKPSSDSAQNSSAFSSQVKGKKRERSDQGSDPAKRERLSKPEDGDSGQSRTEPMLKSEIAKITDKGGLVDFEGVEKLVKLMQPDSPDKKIDLASRVMLVDVIAVTDRVDCLGRFVELMGLPVLDEWLQEVHKGKIGDSSSPKESDKSVEEFLLVLLRALDKLPVNLHALQTCNVGKSVNHLRSHKNSEIQKKARSLVDTWKKRVEAEMNMNDAKSGTNRGVSWPSKPAPSEASHVGNRKSGGAAEAGMRSSVMQSSTSKSSQVKLGAGESVAKVSALPGSIKSVTTSAGGNSKDPHFRMLVSTGTSDLPLTPIKEERSSSSSQSQNNSQSCSSDHAKTVASSCREDARSSTAGSVTVSKSSSGASRHRKSSNGVQGTAVSGAQKEAGSGKVSSSNKNLTSEKASPIGVSHDKLTDIPVGDHSNNQRLIVRLPNTGRSPSRGASGGSFEDPAVISGRASPQGERYDNPDRRLRGRNEALRSNVVSSTNSDLCQVKDGLGGSNEANMLTAACDERQKTSEDGEKIVEASKATGKLLGAIARSGKSYEASLSSINALVESCVKFSEASGSASPDDDVGMNLLASVAAGEILKSDNVSPLASPHINSPVAEESCSGNDGKLRHTGEEVSQIQCQPHDGDGPGATATTEQRNSIDSMQGKNDLWQSPMLTNFSGDSKVTSVGCEEKKGECSTVFNSSSINLQQTAEGPCLRSDVKSGELTCDSSVAALPFHAKNESFTEAEGVNQSHERRKSGAHRSRSGGVSDSKSKAKSFLFDEDRKVDYVDERTAESNVSVVSELATKSAKVEKDINEKPAYSSLEMGGHKQNTTEKESSSGGLNEQKPYSVAEVHKDSLDGKNEDARLPSSSGNVLHVEPKAEMPDDTKTGGHTEQRGRPTMGISSSVSDHDGECAEENSERKEVPGESVSHVESPTAPVLENETREKSCGSKMDGVEAEGMEEWHASSANVSDSAAGSGMSVKLDFDLNEGFPVDDGNQGDAAKSSVPGISSAVNLPCPLPIPISSMSGSFSTSITVAAAAKGSFVLPENPVWSKGELGWKGSAATSAFRPAEPRKNLEMPLNTSEIPVLDTASSKASRPPLDFDLNVPDERVLEDVASGQASCSESALPDRVAGGLDLDLNRVDESPDTGPFLQSNSSRFEIPAMPGRPSLPVGMSNGALNASRDFDLNNGPGLDEVVTETAPRSQPIKSGLPFPSSVPGMRMNGTDFANFPSWFPPANAYSAITVPSILPGRGEQSYIPTAGSQRILPPSSSSASFGPELYRGPVLSSSPAVPFPPAAPFQYPGFPFETSFSLSSNTFSGASTAYVDSSSGAALCFPTIPSQLVGPAGVVSSPYPRPYVMNVPGGTSNAGSDGRKWGGQLDLNAGPGGNDTEQRDERLPTAIRQHSLSGSQVLLEDQMKMYQVAGGVASSIFKRKEPDGGWDGADRFGYKQSSWQ